MAFLHRLRNNPVLCLPLIFFAVMAVHGSWIGLTDDEAYYWVLAQKPALGYAYHPPAVAWLIALFQALFGWLFGTHSAFLVRLPGLVCVASMLALALQWLSDIGVPRERLWKSGAVLLSFAGVFGLSWMMVPDLPLFFGFTLAFVSVWRICNGGRAPYMEAAAGAALLLLSKYSGILALGSAGLAVLFWAPRERRWKALAALVAGGAIGVAPALIWNARHEWVSILYQIESRHEGASVSWVRYARFWGAELIAAGPVAISCAAWLLIRALRSRDSDEAKITRFLALWILPAALVFCTQPLMSDFKPHWAFIVWWPAFIGLAWAAQSGVWRRAAAFQLGLGSLVGVLVLLSCHLPLGSAILSWRSGAAGNWDPRLDVTNDLYGWSELRAGLRERLDGADRELPVIGLRYQTASQAAFALSDHRVTMLPTDLKSRDEWPVLGVSEGEGPAWPRLTRPVLFVRDNRYDALPEFPGAKCEKRARFDRRRFGLAAKWIEVWRCEPGGARP